MRWNLARNRPWLAASSGLIPQTVAPAATRSSFASRKAQASVVQPGCHPSGRSRRSSSGRAGRPAGEPCRSRREGRSRGPDRRQRAWRTSAAPQSGGHGERDSHRHVEDVSVAGVGPNARPGAADPGRPRGPAAPHRPRELPGQPASRSTAARTATPAATSAVSPRVQRASRNRDRGPLPNPRASIATARRSPWRIARTRRPTRIRGCQPPRSPRIRPAWRSPCTREPVRGGGEHPAESSPFGSPWAPVRSRYGTSRSRRRPLTRAKGVLKAAPPTGGPPLPRPPVPARTAPARGGA